MAFRKGADKAKEATKGGGQFAKTHYLSLEDGEKITLRFLTDVDEWIVVDQHQMVKTKPAPADLAADRKWPDRMGAVCRNDEAFEGVYDGCYICEFLVDGKSLKKPSARTWALACIREEVVEDGRIVGYRDGTREVQITDEKGEATGKVEVEKAILVVNMGFKNFFSILQGFGNHFGTICDRDMVVTRSGATKDDTTYSIIPLAPIPVDDKGTIFDTRNPEHRARYGEPDSDALNLEKIITERASDEFYARFFDPRVTVKEGGEVAQTGASPDVPKPDNDADPDRLRALADRVKGYSGEGEAPAENGDTAPAAEEKPKEEAAASAGAMRDFK